MAVGTTTTFKQTRDSLITDALLDVGIVGLGQPVDADLIQFAARKLNMMLKAWMADGLNLWKIRETTLFLNKSQPHYKIGPTTTDNITTDDPIHKSIVALATSAGATTITVDNTAAHGWANQVRNSAALVTGMYVGIQLIDNSMYWTTVSSVPTSTTFTIPAPGISKDIAPGAVVFAYTNKADRPLAVWDAMRRDKSENDVPIFIISRNEYYTFGRKITEGTPSQFFFNPSTLQQVPGQQSSELFTYVSPGIGTDRLVFNAQYPVRDILTPDADFDFPQEWLLAIQTNLAILLGPGAGLTTEQFKKLQFIAQTEKDRVMSWDRENVSMFIQPQWSPR
jgi:hypothetical protein